MADDFTPMPKKPVVPLPPLAPVVPDPTPFVPTWGNPTPPVTTPLPWAVGPGEPVTGLPGSSLDTLYGVDSESYLTDDQRKLARQIQGKFDASLDNRDRVLQQYSAPRLSSYAEDEALARAMSLARGVNYRAPTRPTGPAPQTAVGPGIPPGYLLTGPTAPGSNSGSLNSAQWQRIMSGLASIVPLLFGKDAYGQFLNKGLISTVKEWIYGKEGAVAVSDDALQRVIMQGGAEGGAPYPTQAAVDWWAAQSTQPTVTDVPWNNPVGWGLDDGSSSWWTTPDTSALDLGNGWDFGSFAGP